METSEAQAEDFTPRHYQTELMKIALEKNTIIFLPTGAGKTFIAIMVLKRMSADIIEPSSKVSVILVNTIALAEQHSKYVRQHTTFTVGCYTGEMNVDFWDKAQWLSEINKNQILVMTSQILFNIINWKLLDISQINLLIFDECHRGVSDHAMRQLMMNFENSPVTPRVLGLTATLLNKNCSPTAVMKEVRDLEITFHSKVATVDGLEQVVGYSTNPQERVTYFNSHHPTKLEQEAIQDLDKLEGLLKSIKTDYLMGYTKQLQLTLKPLEPDSGLKKLGNLVMDLRLHIEMLGLYGGYIAAICHMIQVERLRKHIEVKSLYEILSYVHVVFGSIKHKFLNHMKHHTDYEKLINFSSPKVLKFIGIFDHFKLTSTENLCGLVFVQRRFTAKIIFHILKTLSTNPDYSNITPNFMVGYNNNPYNDTRENLLNMKKNKEVLEMFMNKENNVLCASDVLEEGVDIPTCTFVVKFDKPNNYRSYVQSKGRARHKKSWYYMMVESEEADKYNDTYSKFKAVEQTLNDYLIGKNEQREDVTELELNEMYNEHLLPPYYANGPKSAQVNLLTSIPLVSHYCQSLPSDIYTVYAPEWYVVTNKFEAQYSVVICLPIISTILEPIHGPFMPNKKLAKRAAALKACEILHKAGELNDDLMPRKRLLDDDEVNTNFLFLHYPIIKEPAAGTSKHRRLHPIKIADATKEKITTTNPVYLHILNVEPNFTPDYDDICKKTVYDLYNSNLCYGIITSKRLPNVCEFPIYVSSGSINVNIKVNQQCLTLSADQLEDIKDFQYLVYYEILKVLKPFLMFDESDNAEAIFVVPVQKDVLRVDFEVLKKYKQIEDMTREPSTSEKEMIKVDDTYFRAIVSPWYRRDTSLYVVSKICKDMSPQSDFPSENYDTYEEYYLDKHKQVIINKSQPLILVKGISKRLNLYKPRGREGKKKRDLLFEEMDEYLVPELIIRQLFPSALWVQASFLPTILSRLSFLLRCQELQCRISKEAKFTAIVKSKRPLELHTHLLNYDPAVEEKKRKNLCVINNELINLLPLPSSSLTLTTYNKDYVTRKLEEQFPWKTLEEPKDIERELHVTVMDIEYYEHFIGMRVEHEDRLLKNVMSEIGRNPAITYPRSYVPAANIELLQKKSVCFEPELATIYEALATSKCNDIVNLERLETLGDSFLKYISSVYIHLNFPSFDEGRATSLKGRLVSNKNLYYLAQRKEIPGILRFSDLSPKENWLPPSFCVPPTLEKRIMDKEISVNALFQFDIPFEQQISGKLENDILEQIATEDYPIEQDEESSYVGTSQYLKRQFIGDKFVADAVESLLGAHFQSGGMEGGVKFVEWMNIIPKSENVLNLIKKEPPNPIIDPNKTLREINFHIPQWQEIERRLGYHFKNRAYLLQALTHASYTPNRITHCYQRLEFLGDAVLDFIITCYIFESCGKLTPGDVTDLRSALVNNNTFASLVVRNGFHKFLLMMNSTLQRYIDKFDQFLATKNYEIDDEVLILLEEDDMNIAEYIDVPKVLGDIFEALAGAVYLDSGKDLNTVWKVFHKLMWREIDMFSQNVPKNIVRKLYETENIYPEFGKATAVPNGKTMVSLQFISKGQRKIVHGFGSNKAMAKKAAAKIALRALEK